MHFWTGFTSGWLLIGLSELGDKTFFIGAILAMRHPRWWVFLGVIGGLATMTLVSVGMGQVAALFPPRYVRGLAVALLLGFGLKLLYEASRMSGQATLAAEQEEARAVVEQKEQGVVTWSAGAVVMEAFTLTFVAEWGDRTQVATITLASAHHALGVLLGAICGHAMCAALAVVCGNLLAGRISERLLTALGGVLFLGFGMLAAWEAR
ncbi:TMEM165/GDT1 family protein [Gloeomargarita sp.]